MLDDDGVLDDDAILGGDDIVSARRAAGRGFWIVMVAIATICAVLLVAIFANRPLVNTIAQSESELRHALGEAQRQYAESGTFENADAVSLIAIDPQLRYTAADIASPGPGFVSVYASATVWAAAVRARTGACFWIKQAAGQDTKYGIGTVCTGTAALAADGPYW